MVLKTVFQDFLILTLSGNPKVLHSGYDISIYCQKKIQDKGNKILNMLFKRTKNYSVGFCLSQEKYQIIDKVHSKTDAYAF